MHHMMLFPYLLLFLTPASSPDEDAGLFCVMTYNIRYAGDEQTEGINSWNNRKSLVASVIRFHRADIVGLQEALKHQLDDLVELLPGYAWVGVGRDDGKAGGEFSAIMFKQERFEVLEHSTFWLSETTEKPSRGWDAAFNRVVTWARMNDRRTNRTFYFFNTHFDHQGNQARAQSALLLKRKVAQIGGHSPTIITGDFNFRPESDAYRSLTDDNGFVDAQEASRHGHYGSMITFNDFGRSVVEGNKIDYILVKNNVEVIQHGIISETFDGRFPSDHMPVLAEVQIP